MFNPINIDYTSCFCEENVYKLAEKACQDGFEDKTFVVFISSESKCTPIWFQKSSASIEEPVLWDYHVVLLLKSNACCSIYDTDSRLSFPVSFDEYFEKSFRPEIQFKPEYLQRFRVIPASNFLKVFASDRSHMLSSGKAFPEWPLIRGPSATSAMNLDRFIDVSPSIGDTSYGEVFSRVEFKKWACL